MVACESCPAGKFQNEQSGDSCKLCPAGRYQPSAQKNHCKLCPVGKISTHGATSCQTVSPGSGSFCSARRPCGVSLGTCAGDHECRQNLKCVTGSCTWGGNKCCVRRTPKNKFACRGALPGTEYFARGYSALVGKPIYEDEAHKGKVFDFTCHANLRYQSWLLFDDVDATFWSRCLSNGRDTEISDSYSSSSMTQESEDTNAGYDKTWTVEAGVEYKGLSASVKTTNRLALTYSNSKTSSDGNGASSKGYSRRLSVRRMEKWYSGELRPQSVKLTDNFKQATFALAKHFNKEVMSWFAEFGGWALLAADMGSLSRRSLFIKNTASTNNVDWLRSNVQEYGFEFFGLGGAHTKSTSNSAGTSSSNLASFSSSELQTVGYVPRKFESCGAGSAGTVAQTPEPVPIRYGLVPLWDSAIPLQTITGLTWNEVQTLRKNLELFIVRVQQGGMYCRETYCNNHGSCAAAPDAFQVGAYFDASQTGASRYIKFWNTDKCICDHGRAGSRCQSTAVIPAWEVEINARVAREAAFE